MKYRIILLFLPLLLLTGSLCAGDLTKQLEEAGTALTKMGAPYYKLTNISRIQVNNPALGKTPFAAFRFILSGTPLKDLPRKDEDPEIKRRLEIPELIDIIMVPADSTVFRMDKALGLSTPSSREETKYLFYEQFGFQWRKLNSNLKRYTLYIGKNEHFYCFAAGNLAFLLRLQNALKFKDGFQPEEYLTEALAVTDLYDTTAATALHLLPIYGNTSLPYLKRFIDDAILQEESVSIYFQALAKIATPESFALLGQYATGDQDRTDVLIPLFDTLIANKLINEQLLPCYRQMLRSQYRIEFASSAMEKCKKVAELKAALHEIIQRPMDYSNFRFALMALETWSKPQVIPRHKEAQEQIMILLLRGGELPGGTVFQSVSKTESDAARNVRLNEEDEQRLKPLLEYLLNAPEYRLTILMALDLTMLDDAGMPKPTKQYAERVRDNGRKILLSMMADPGKKQEIEHYIRTLAMYTQNKRELELLQELARKMQIPIASRSLQ